MQGRKLSPGHRERDRERRRSDPLTSESDREEAALLAIDEDPRQKRNLLRRSLLERRAFIAERVGVPQGTNKNRRKHGRNQSRV